MKPFNLEAALNGAKVITRDGLTVRGLSQQLNSKYPLYGFVEGKAYTWTEKGKWKEADSHNDLFMGGENTVEMEWISVKDRLPDDDTGVIAAVLC